MSACPACGDDANVQKVSGIYRARGHGGPDDDLAALLAPPRATPALPAASASAAAGDGSLGDPGPIAAYGGVMAVLGGVVGWCWSPDPLSPMTYAWVGIMTGLVVGMVVGIIYGALRGAVASSSVVPMTASRQRGSSEQQRRFDQWEQAYYCHKHDVVMLPGESKTLSPTELRTLMSGET